MENAMRAIVQERHGSTEVLQLMDIDRPIPKDDEVLVRNHAASVGAWDAHTMTGEPHLMGMLGILKPKNKVAGLDLAGTVEESGNNVTQFQPGDEVYGEAHGTFADFVCVPEGTIAPKPANLTFEEAAAVPTAAITALIGLRDEGRVQPGQNVLIIGASGGVGTFAVQIAKSLGATVTAVCSTPNVEMVQSIGADRVIDYTLEDFAEGGQRYDVILELADTRSLSDLRRALAPRGTLVMSSGVGGSWIGPLGRILKAFAVSPFIRHRVRVLTVKATTENLIVLKELIEAGKVKPVIDRTYPLSRAPEAVGYLAQGHTQGKTVITIDPTDTTENSD